MARTLSSVVVERVIDLGSVVLLFAAFARLVPMPPLLSQAASLAAIAVAVAVVSGAVLVWKADGAEAILRPRLARIGLRLDWAWARFHEVCAGFRAVGSGGRLGAVLGLTVAIWAMTIVLAYFAMGAFLDPDATAAGLVVVVSNLGGALPSAPGGLGVVQGFAKMALVAPFHVPEDRALAFVFVWSLSQQLLLVVLGLVGLGRLGVSLTQAKRNAEGEARKA
jgi:glycosyltransferase 2 family protein